MKKLFLSVLLYTAFLFLVAAPSEASKFKRTGTTGFAFLEIPGTARQAALGDAYSAIGGSTDASGIFVNPAALGYVAKPTFTITYGTWLVNTSHQTVGFAYSMGSAGVLGISAIRFDAGNLIETVADATVLAGFRETGTMFNMGALAIGPTYSLRMTDRFSFGVTVRYAREGVSNITSAQGSDFSASNFLAEVGTLYYTGFGSLRFATNIQSIGFDTKYVADPFQSPVVYRIGAGYDFFDKPDSPAKLTTVLEAIHPTDSPEKVMAGAELWILNKIALRGGYKFSYDEEGFTGGVGLKIDVGGGRPIGLDFAYVDYGRLKSVTRFTLNFEM